MKAPFSLESGLLLERSSTLLPWGCKAETLTTLGHPDVHKHKSTTNITWNNETVFGGLPVQVAMQGAAGSNAFWLEHKSSVGSAHAGFAELLAELDSRLGEPHSITTDGGHPWARWAWGDVVVSLRIAERFTEYVSFMVSRGIVRA